MVCAAVLSAGLAISSLPAGALAVHAEENTQVQEVAAETGTAGTDNASAESAESHPSAAPEPSEANAAENSTDTAEEASPALALRMLAVSADAAAGTLGENVDSGSQGSGETVKIDYDENTTLHGVKVNGQDMVVFCMNNDLHWPHNTPTFQAPANYKPVDTGLTDEQENQMTKLLYAGYPYNGFILFQIEDKSEPLSEDDFDKLLIPPAWIRSDFPDLGETQFTYKNVAPNKENANKLDDFLANAYTYYKNGVTASRHTHDDIIAATFWRAASVIKNYGYNNALNAGV